MNTSSVLRFRRLSTGRRSQTYSAHTLTVGCDIEIGSRIGMAVPAMSFPSVDGRDGVASHRVDPRGDGLKMVDGYAASVYAVLIARTKVGVNVVAEMVELVALWHGTFGEHPSIPVGCIGSIPMGWGESAIPTTEGTRPQCARPHLRGVDRDWSFDHLRPEPDFGGCPLGKSPRRHGDQRITVQSPSVIVGSAPSSCQHRAWASAYCTWNYQRIVQSSPGDDT